MMTDWNGTPPNNGWYWLQRQRDGEWRLAHWCRGCWRVSDAIGRTRIQDAGHVAQLFSLGEPLLPKQSEVRP